MEGVLGVVRDYLGLGRRRRAEAVTDPASLRRFIETRASYVAQTSLYGYLRTRAGLRYPELFDDDPFVASVNIAKWQMWLACLSDVSVYAGGMVARASDAPPQAVGQLMRDVVASILADTGVPDNAGPDYKATADRVLERVASCDWAAVADGEAAFTESPPALVRWAPIVDELKEADEPIVVNSVRFRWKEVRDDLRRSLHAEAVLLSAGAKV
ncbi:MAG: esterase [Alphaproteobacteria bacterium]|nr:esterase [Alphaproteobacteria bacterium]